MDWVESLSERRSLFALCIAHCSQFEHSGDSTMQLNCSILLYMNCYRTMNCSILLYITLQIHSVEHSYGLGGESLRETFTICIMHRSLLAV